MGSFGTTWRHFWEIAVIVSGKKEISHKETEKYKIHQLWQKQYGPLHRVNIKSNAAEN